MERHAHYLHINLGELGTGLVKAWRKRRKGTLQTGTAVDGGYHVV